MIEEYIDPNIYTQKNEGSIQKMKKSVKYYK